MDVLIVHSLSQLPCNHLAKCCSHNMNLELQSNQSWSVETHCYINYFLRLYLLCNPYICPALITVQPLSGAHILTFLLIIFYTAASWFLFSFFCAYLKVYGPHTCCHAFKPIFQMCARHNEFRFPFKSIHSFKLKNIIGLQMASQLNLRICVWIHLYTCNYYIFKPYDVFLFNQQLKNRQTNVKKFYFPKMILLADFIGSAVLASSACTHWLWNPP